MREMFFFFLLLEVIRNATYLTARRRRPTYFFHCTTPKGENFTLAITTIELVGKGKGIMNAMRCGVLIGKDGMIVFLEGIYTT